MAGVRPKIWQGDFFIPNGDKCFETLRTSSFHYGFSVFPAFTGMSQDKARQLKPV
jgi:hypothetical protein